MAIYEGVEDCWKSEQVVSDCGVRTQGGAPVRHLTSDHGHPVAGREPHLGVER